MELDRSGSSLDIQELLSVRERIDKLLANQHEEAQPRADLLDTGDSYRLIMEVPGLKEENLEIALDGEELPVSEFRADSTPEVDYFVGGRQTRPLPRTCRLPAAVDASQASAHLQQALLVVVLPRS